MRLDVCSDRDGKCFGRWFNRCKILISPEADPCPFKKEYADMTGDKWYPYNPPGDLNEKLAGELSGGGDADGDADVGRS